MVSESKSIDYYYIEINRKIYSVYNNKFVSDYIFQCCVLMIPKKNKLFLDLYDENKIVIWQMHLMSP